MDPSPLTRGKRKHRVEHRLHGGLIPAHAGKTQDQPRRTPQTSAHPRSRGENVFKVFEEGLHTGSSPLTRGKPQARRRDRRRRRLIPPSRGENTRYACHAACTPGSSPLTRGKPPLRPLAHRRIRLIPAHAGKTARKRLDVGAGGAHPRSRGENWSPSRKITAAFGSSPLTRGKLRAHRSRVPGAGLIPAHAGKTGRTHPCPSQHAAHPRSRGENHHDCDCEIVPAGSSPLTRGKPGLVIMLGWLVGLIPAHAGKTPDDTSIRTCVPAHPRSRGENPRLVSRSRIHRGSSPLTRGKHP